MASTTDKITDVRNAARPNSARVSSPRTAGGTTLACDNLTGWPTASKVHFVTYQLDSTSEMVTGTQLDCYGIVSSNNITSFTVVDGTDTGNSTGDVVEMLPTAAWGQDLADALTVEHTRTGAHTAITATSVASTGAVSGTTGTFSGTVTGANLTTAGTATAATVTATSSVGTDIITERTAATGVTIDGVLLKDNIIATNGAVGLSALNNKTAIFGASSTSMIGGTPPNPSMYYMQAGSSVVSFSSNAATITFPQPYQNGVLSVVAMNGDANAGEGISISNSNVSLTSFRVQQNAATGTVRVNWIALGW